MKIHATSSLVYRWVLASLVAGLFSIPASASSFDVTAFGGIQRNGQLKLESAQSSTTNFAQTFDPKKFGVFGVRLGHGSVIGGEHTFSYAPNFVNSDSHAFIYHSNLRVQIPIPVVKPYVTAGAGFIRSTGNSVTSLRTEFAFNYGGGVKLTAGPVGVNFDLRGYTLPAVKVDGFVDQSRLNIIQPSVGIVFTFK